MTLQRLSELGTLTGAERIQFAAALWTAGEKVFGVPRMDPFLGSVLLKLPGPPRKSRESAVLIYLTRSDLPRFRRRSIGTDGTGGWSYAMLSDPDSFLIEWLVAAPAAPFRDNGRGVINPAVSDLASLVQKLWAWWSEEGRPLMTADRPMSLGLESFVDAFHRRCHLVLEVIRDVVLTRTPDGRRGAALAEQSLALVDEFRQAGVATQSIRPAVLRFRPDATADVVSMLIAGLVSTQQEEYLQAIRGLIFWLRTQGPRTRRPRRYTLPVLPDQLLQQLGVNIAVRRQPGLIRSLEAAEIVCSDCRELASPQFLSSVALGLRYLFTEAAYRDRSDFEGIIPYPEVPDCRIAITRLAYAASSLLPAGETAAVQWLAAASTDTLPAVRSAAQGGRN
jgi:hypothetical protein